MDCECFTSKSTCRLGMVNDDYQYVWLFIINPVGSMIQPNRQDKYSFDTDSLASVFLLTRSHGCPIVPSGQPDHRSTKDPVSHHVVRPQSTNKRAPHSVGPTDPSTGQTTHDPRQPVCADYTPGRGHDAGNIVSVRTPTGTHIVLRNSAADYQYLFNIQKL